MAIPEMENLLRPALSLLGERDEVKIDDFRKGLGESLGLSPEDLGELLPSGKQTVFFSRAGWALSNLKGAGLAENPRRGLWRILEPGRSLLADPSVETFDLEFLAVMYPAYVAWKEESAAKSKAKAAEKAAAKAGSPKEGDFQSDHRGGFCEGLRDVLREKAEILDETVERELLERLRTGPSELLVRAAAALMARMSSAKVLLEGDVDKDGAEAMVTMDPFSFQTARLHVERGKVGEGRMSAFITGLFEDSVPGGIFVGFEGFEDAARGQAERSMRKVALMDGAELARLMRVHGVGVRTKEVHEVQVVDEGWFA